MKILHLISQHPEATGSGVTLQNIIREAAASGHENFLVAGVSEHQSGPLVGVAADHCRFIRFGGGDLDFTIPGMSDVMPYPSSRFSELTTVQLDAYERVFGDTVKAVVEHFAPDIIHSHHLWLATAVTRKLFPAVPLVTSCHSTDLRQFVSCPHLQERVLSHCRQVTRVLALSDDQAKKITAVYGIDSERIDVVGGGFNDTMFCYSEKSPAPPIQMLYAGKLSYAKGVDWLLRTVAGLKEDNVQLHLVGSGSGPEARTCHDLAEKLDQVVTMHGRLDQEELARLMQQCHIFILPSFYEGLSLVLLEALASGCRLIATDLPGCRELLAGVPKDLAALVKLPAMHHIDQPDPEDWPLLEKRLAEAIGVMAKLACHQSSPPVTDSLQTISMYRWATVFARMEKSYRQALTA